jgi:hypothetical protein
MAAICEIKRELYVPSPQRYMATTAVMQYIGSGPYDPASGRLIKRVFQRIIKGDPRKAMHVLWRGERLFCDHGFYQLSADNGETWDRGRLLKYEDGPDFDPEDWGNDCHRCPRS